MEFEDFLDLEFDIRHEMSVSDDKGEENKKKIQEILDLLEEIDKIYQ